VFLVFAVSANNINHCHQSSIMSLAGQTVWVVGGVGVVGRGIARGLLQAGATVIVNSRAPERLERIQEDLKSAEHKLVAVEGSMRTPTLAMETVEGAIAHPSVKEGTIDHVVAHGAVRYWSTIQEGCDETFSLTKPKTNFLNQTMEEFVHNSSTLASVHYVAAQILIPHIATTAATKKDPQQIATYTFCTGDGGGHPSSLRTSMGELNSHHVWGLSAALRRELNNTNNNNNNLASNVWVRELRVGLQVNRPLDVREADPRRRPLSEDIGDLLAGMIVTAPQYSLSSFRGGGGSSSSSSFERTYAQESNGLIKMDTRAEMERLLKEYHADHDKNLGPLPSFSEFAGSL
jgi:NAD(P)-dependent dehydrogenase (short-subunit alcohol dehydrogenase family)